MRFLFLLFIIIPIIEITILIQVGQAIGGWYTVGLVLLSAFIGVNMLRYQGLSTLARAQQRMGQGEVPGQEMVEAIVLAVGGALLVTPGFVTDIIGFSCLVPGIRKGLVKVLLSRFTIIAAGQTTQAHFHTHAPDDSQPPRSGDVIDGEYTRRD
ncbi:MAG: FxsA family protein [Oceanospirillales bacterium]|uniref:UPF0716 protein FxsA n=1 Tax=Marinobacterium halophilum TaxID=267374 RepID=A0A2P8EYS9_9GAMM|nr:FxsA family protein [Marinobacterium halophilum]MBR9827247.1 FxsA family protein [Oceanospirillales bacterium]PSL14621.1 UPF0716 protein FxsA [Marinobacterium halophilum]